MTHSHRRTRGRVARVAALALVCASVPAALTACFADTTAELSPAPTPVASMAQPIPTGDGVLTIGVLVPLSGANAAVGAAELAGVELAARDIDEAGGVRHTSIVVRPGDAGDDGSLVGGTVAAFAAGGVDAIVGPGSAGAFAAVDAAAAEAGIPALSAVADPVAADDAFQARLRTSDPSLSDTRWGAESYDATIMIALAAQLAGDDGRSSIAEFLPAVVGGDVPCSSYGECLHVLKARADIRYTGVTGQLSMDVDATAPGSLRPIGLHR